MRWMMRLAACVASFGLLVPCHDALAQQQNGNQNGNGAGYNWSGLYGGGNLGGAFGGSDFLTAGNAGLPFLEGEVYPGLFNAATPGIIAAYRDNDVDIRSFTGGFQAGYNFRASGFLFGIELDINFLNAHKSKTTSAFGDPIYGSTLYTFKNEVDANYIFSARPRVGLPVGPGVLYATGGVAVTTLKYNHQFNATGGAFDGLFENASVSETKAGWTLGAGYELPVSSNMSVRAEYLFTDFGSVSTDNNKIFPLTPDFACGADTGGVGAPPFGPLPVVGSTPRQCFNHKADMLLHSIRLGLNFKF